MSDSIFDIIAQSIANHFGYKCRYHHHTTWEAYREDNGHRSAFGIAFEDQCIIVASRTFDLNNPNLLNDIEKYLGKPTYTNQDTK